MRGAIAGIRRAGQQEEKLQEEIDQAAAKKRGELYLARHGLLSSEDVARIGQGEVVVEDRREEQTGRVEKLAAGVLRRPKK